MNQDNLLWAEMMRKEFTEEKTLNCEGKDACNWIIVKHQVEHCGTSEEQLEQYFKGKIKAPCRVHCVTLFCKLKISY